MQMIVLSLTLLAAQTAPTTTASTVPAVPPVLDETQERGEFRIGAGDVLRIIVWKTPDLSHEVPVRPDGMVSLPLLNDVQAAGLTPMQLRERLAQKFQKYVSAPEVSVIVLQIHSFKVSVLGKVRRPGRFDLLGPTTVLDIVALAGGFEEFSSPDEMYILRAQGRSYERIPVKYSWAISAGGRQVNVDLRPGDFVVVP